MIQSKVHCTQRLYGKDVITVEIKATGNGNNGLQNS